MRRFILAWAVLLGITFLLPAAKVHALGSSTVTVTVSIKPYYPPIFKVTGSTYSQESAKQALIRFESDMNIDKP